jgi:hypothetical protein
MGAKEIKYSGMKSFLDEPVMKKPGSEERSIHFSEVTGRVFFNVAPLKNEDGGCCFC